MVNKVAAVGAYAWTETKRDKVYKQVMLWIMGLPKEDSFEGTLSLKQAVKLRDHLDTAIDLHLYSDEAGIRAYDDSD